MNYLKTARRSLWKNRSHALINIFGLSLGIMACTIILTLVKHEAGFDQFHSRPDRIYRLVSEYRHDGRTSYDVSVPFPVPTALKTDFLDLEEAFWIFYQWGELIRVKDRKLEQEGILFADPDFLRTFTFPILKGESPDMLSGSGKAILTEKAAIALFGSTDCIGEVFNYNNQKDIVVVAIAQNPNPKSHIHFEMIISADTYRELNKNNGITSFGSYWGGNNTYVVLKPGERADSLTARINRTFLPKYFDVEDRNRRTFLLQPLPEIHYASEYDDSIVPPVSKEVIRIFSVIGIFILLMACINFVNMSTARAVQRSREVGIRKVLGGVRIQLIGQFLGENAIVTLVSLIFGTGLTFLVYPLLKSGLSEAFRAELVFNADLGLILLSTGIGVILVSGIYPALVLSGFDPVAALRNRLDAGRSSGINLRKVLVTVQFFITQLFILGTLIAWQQMNFLRSKELGFRKDAIVEVNLPKNDKETLNKLRTRLLENPAITAVSFNNGAPVSNSNWHSGLRVKQIDPENRQIVQLKFVDSSYVALFDLKLVAGAQPQFSAADSMPYFLVNETFVQKMKIASNDAAIGEQVDFWDDRIVPIAGVVKDFHTKSLHQPIVPTAIVFNMPRYYYIHVTVHPASMSEGLKHLNTVWEQTFPDFLYQQNFLDELIARRYRSEDMLFTAFQLFAGLAIAIGSLGLLGLVSFLAIRKTREIGVRKVLGASSGEISMLFVREIGWLLLTAFLLATPVAWFFADFWLRDFAFRSTPGVHIYLSGLIFTGILAGATSGFTIWKAMRADPVAAIKTE